jgi:hypothetical protein
MKLRAVGVACLASLLAFPVLAEGAQDCGPATLALKSLEGYQVTIPPAGPEQGWCVLDGASFRSQVAGWPDLDAERLRLRQTATEFELDVQGLRATAKASDRDMDDRLRSLMRLQSGDLRLRAMHDVEADVVRVTGLRLRLSGGTTVELDAEIKGAGLSMASLPLGAVTRADLVWRNDGKLLRPVMDMAGEGLAGAPGAAAVDAARVALADMVDILPVAALDDASRKALEEAVGSMPQGRGKLTLSFASQEGIGAARLAVAALAGEPLSAKSLATLLDGATIRAVWQPGLAP